MKKVNTKKSSKINKKISVIVVTKNRSQKLYNCIHALLNQTLIPQIIVMDYGTDSLLGNDLSKYLRENNITHIELAGKIKSKALNLGIKYCAGPLIAFTDEDCIPHKDWIKNLVKKFESNIDISGVFGKVLPFRRQNNKKMICPSVFTKLKARLVTEPTIHYENIGYGNNMAFRKAVLMQVGGFNVFLGPGSVGIAAEDADLALRVLFAGKKLFYEPSIVVYHDKYLTVPEMQEQEARYMCGEIACYLKYKLKGWAFAEKVIKSDLEIMNYNYYEFKKNIKNFSFNKKDKVSKPFRVLQYGLRGYILGYLLLLTSSK